MLTVPYLLIVLITGLVPIHGSRCDVLDFGAKGDNHTNDAHSINQAIQSKSCDTIVFKSDRSFVTGTLRMKSHLTIVVEPGATVRAAKNGQDAYDPIEENPWSSFQDFGHTYFRNSMFCGFNVSNVTITGGGVIHGEELSSGTTVPGDGNKMFAIRSSDHVVFDNIHLIRGGWFTVIITDVDHFTMTNTEIHAARDGIDVCQCRHVTLDRVHIYGGGDDAIAIKSDYSTGMPRPSHDHNYTNLQVGSEGASALRFGSETVGELFDFLFENITITVAAKSAVCLVSMDGSHIHDITYRNITANNTGIPFFLYIGARNRGPPSLGPPSLGPPSLGPPSLSSLPNSRPKAGSDESMQHVGRIEGITVEDFVGHHLYDPHRDQHPFWQWPAAMDGQNVNLTYNVTSPTLIGPNLLFRRVDLHFPGGGTSNLTAIEPPHWANEYEPWRYCPLEYCPGGLSLPSYAFFVRRVTGLVLDRVRVNYGDDEDRREERPAFVVEDSYNVSLWNVSARRGSNLKYDVGLRRTKREEVHAPGLVVTMLNNTSVQVT